jgi:hypothetical protein
MSLPLAWWGDIFAPFLSQPLSLLTVMMLVIHYHAVWTSMAMKQGHFPLAVTSAKIWQFHTNNQDTQTDTHAHRHKSNQIYLYSPSLTHTLSNASSHTRMQTHSLSIFYMYLLHRYSCTNDHPGSFWVVSSRTLERQISIMQQMNSSFHPVCVCVHKPLHNCPHSKSVSGESQSVPGERARDPSQAAVSVQCCLGSSSHLRQPRPGTHGETGRILSFNSVRNPALSLSRTIYRHPPPAIPILPYYQSTHWATAMQSLSRSPTHD